MASLGADRRHRILQAVAAEQSIQVAELARQLDVSEMTIRRDIARLERDGFLRRSYGGASAHITKPLELAFNARALVNAPAKRLIAMTAAELVDGGSTVFLGIGTTVEQFALFFHPTAATVVTPSLPVASLIGSRAGRVVVLGGVVSETELSCHGPVAVSTAHRYFADGAVLGAGAFSAERGLMEFDDETAEVYRAIVEQSARVTVLADSSKLGRHGSVSVCPAAAVGTLVTDSRADPAQLAALRELGVDVHTVDLPGAAPAAPPDGSPGVTNPKAKGRS